MVAAPEQFSCVTHVPLPVQGRDEQTSSYNCVFKTHQSQAYNLVWRMVSDRSLAEDPVQESFVSG